MYAIARRHFSWQLLCGLVSSLTIARACTREAAAEDLTSAISIIFHVAAAELYRTPPEAFIARQLAHANATFAPLGIAFRDGGRASLAAEATNLERRSQRDALLALAQPGAVHCMIVDKLMDVDEPGRERRGVHWHPAHRDRPHIVIVSTLSGDYVLAHELAHYFGNPQHSKLSGNVLSYTPGVEPPFFTKEQRARVARALARMRREREL